MTTKPTPLTPREWPNDIQDPVYFANDQWAVTAYGLECIEDGNPYEWDAARLLKTHESGAGYPAGSAVLSHIGQKTWVHAGQLIEAFRAALQVHCAGQALPFNLEEEELFLLAFKRGST